MGPISFSVLPYEESRRGSRVEVVMDQSNQLQSCDAMYQQNKYCDINILIREIQILDGQKEAVHKDCPNLKKNPSFYKEKLGQNYPQYFYSH